MAVGRVLRFNTCCKFSQDCCGDANLDGVSAGQLHVQSVFLCRMHAVLQREEHPGEIHVLWIHWFSSRFGRGGMLGSGSVKIFNKGRNFKHRFIRTGKIRRETSAGCVHPVCLPISCGSVRPEEGQFTNVTDEIVFEFIRSWRCGPPHHASAKGIGSTLRRPRVRSRVCGPSQTLVDLACADQ